MLSPKKVLSKLDKETVAAMPSIRPLSDVSLFSEDSLAKFIPAVDPESLLVMARDELGAPGNAEETAEAYALREQQWIAFLLCFTAGLRRREAEFVLSSERPPDLKSRIPRCLKTWNALKAWGYSKGIEKKPIHCLRKSIGSIMARRFGIHDAQRVLRHTTPVITSKYYSDGEARVTPGIGGLLAGNVTQTDFQPKVTTSTTEQSNQGKAAAR